MLCRPNEGDIPMFQAPLPLEITRLDAEATAARIGAARAALGERLIILGHHYQREEIIRWADYRGDSLKLSQLAAQHTDVPYIVFCGVHFMAESADVLTDEEQIVILPNLSAGCSMADMANIRQVEDAWCDITGAVAVAADSNPRLRRSRPADESRARPQDDYVAGPDFSPAPVVPITYVNSAANL